MSRGYPVCVGRWGREEAMTNSINIYYCILLNFTDSVNGKCVSILCNKKVKRHC